MALKCFIVEAALANVELLHATDYTTAILPYAALGYKLTSKMDSAWGVYCWTLCLFCFHLICKPQDTWLEISVTVILLPIRLICLGSKGLGIHLPSCLTVDAPRGIN
jgi:hypothetical protein